MAISIIFAHALRFPGEYAIDGHMAKSDASERGHLSHFSPPEATGAHPVRAAIRSGIVSLGGWGMQCPSRGFGMGLT
jgi:hypothetical protein